MIQQQADQQPPQPAPTPYLTKAGQMILAEKNGAARLAAMQAISAKGQAIHREQQAQAAQVAAVELQQRPEMARVALSLGELQAEQGRLDLAAAQASNQANAQLANQQQLQQQVQQQQQQPFSLMINGKQYGAVPNYSPFNGPFGQTGGNSIRPRNYGAYSSIR